jgi:hypothetical protein
MILIETKSCKDALEAKKHERSLIESLSATLIKQMPGRTWQERRHADPMRYALMRQEYDATNKDTLNANRNIKICCEVCKSIVSKRNQAPHLETIKHLKASEAQAEIKQ